MSIRPHQATNTMTTSLMETDTRARKVAKEFAAISKDYGIKLPIPKMTGSIVGNMRM
jgi:hypothetical protein